jgi:hypothetical protein
MLDFIYSVAAPNVGRQFMKDDLKPKSGTDATSVEASIPCESASSSDEQTTKTGDRRQILSAAALAAAVAAVGLPLMRVKPVEAATAYCGSDSFTGFDIGDTTSRDCSYTGAPSDCYIVDNSGGLHWGGADGSDVPPPGDTGSSGDGGSCSSCGSCGGSDYGY